MVKKKTLYVAHRLTNAPLDFLMVLKALKTLLEKDYEILHFLGVNQGTAGDVYERDIIECVASADLVVGICDQESNGLGYEVGARVERYQKPMLTLAHNDTKLTRLLIGSADRNPHCHFLRRYDDLLRQVPGFIYEVLQIVDNQIDQNLPLFPETEAVAV